MLTWERSFFESVRIYLFLLGIIVLFVALLSDEMKRRNKYIFAAISIAILLALPITRRLEIKDYIEKDGYTLIVSDGWFLGSRAYEADPQEYLWEPFLTGFRLDNENKLIYMFWERTPHYAPSSLDEIEFASGTETQPNTEP